MASVVVESSKSEMKQVGKLKYDPKKEIGRGSYGIVYEGLFEDQSGRNLDVAIKRIIRSNDSIENSEANLLEKSTGHPNILRILYCEKDIDFLYIATELCSGTLRGLIGGRIKGIQKETVRAYKAEILYQITQGIHHLHSIPKIVHRDIKPDNILVIAYKSAAKEDIIKLQMKVADFSHCRIRKDHKSDFTNTNMSNPTGTRGWIAPELYESEAYDFPVDVFALGCVFGFTLTDGEHPFGDEFREFKIMKKEPMLWTLETFQTDYSSALDDSSTVFKLIQRMVEVDHKNRPTAEEVLKSDYFQHRHIYNHQGMLQVVASEAVDSWKEDGFEKVKPERALRCVERVEKSVLNSVCRGDDNRYHAMELCDASLEKVFLPKDNPRKYLGPLPNDVDFMLQLSLGLEYIHSHNITHRNIEPGNVLISTSTGTVLVKWSGLGCSKRTTNNGEFSMSGSRGMDAYLAPEMASFHVHDRGESRPMVITIKSDLFPFACVLFKFFTKGIHPFGSNYQEIMTNIASYRIMIDYDRHLVPPYFYELRISHFAYETIKKMLATQPSERPNLREIIPLLTSLKYKIYGNSDKVMRRMKRDAAYEKLKYMKEKLITICSLTNPNEEQIQRLIHMVAENTSGFGNIPDENGFSPLILLCSNHQSKSLLRCIEALLKTHPTAGNVINVNYQDRNGFTALHHLCMNNYFHEDFFAILKLLITNQDIDLNKDGLFSIIFANIIPSTT